MPRSSHVRLDKQAVLLAAITILNQEGASALTLSRLAEKLGIQTPSLYNHIDGLPGLQKDLAVENASRLADRLSEAAMCRSGRDLVLESAQAFRAYVRENPGLYLFTLRSSGTQPVQNPDLVAGEERTLKVGLAMMASFGLTGEDAIHGLRAFRSLVHGFATLEAAGGFGLPQDCDESFTRMINQFITGLEASNGRA
jgi:AcrR family transcriptional regulator